MEEIDIWRSAAQFLKMHGSDAVIKAALRADQLLAAGDTDGVDTWKRIMAAISTLKNTAPNSSAEMN